MAPAARAGIWPSALERLPGALAGLVAAFAAMGLGALLGAPPALLAVGAGLAVATLPRARGLAAGLELWTKGGLRLGVALMGAQLAPAELLSLGLPTLAASGAIVFTGLLAGTVLGLALGLPLVEAAIAACAVSICGASAAMAAAQVAPSGRDLTHHTARVVVAVNLLSTGAMLLYPVLTGVVGLSPTSAGLFFGLSIHDVAQVAAAGASVSRRAAEAAALAKLDRILWLGPAVVVIGFALAALAGGRTDEGRRISLRAPPAFVFGFAGLAAARWLGLVPAAWLTPIAEASKVLVLGGVFALSAQLDPRAVLSTPPRLVAQLTLATALVAAAAFLAVRLIAP